MSVEVRTMAMSSPALTVICAGENSNELPFAKRDGHVLLERERQARAVHRDAHHGVDIIDGERSRYRTPRVPG